MKVVKTRIEQRHLSREKQEWITGKGNRYRDSVIWRQIEEVCVRVLQPLFWINNSKTRSSSCAPSCGKNSKWTHEKDRSRKKSRWRISVRNSYVLTEIYRTGMEMNQGITLTMTEDNVFLRHWSKWTDVSAVIQEQTGWEADFRFDYLRMRTKSERKHFHIIIG